MQIEGIIPLYKNASFIESKTRRNNHGRILYELHWTLYRTMHIRNMNRSYADQPVVIACHAVSPLSTRATYTRLPTCQHID